MQGINKIVCIIKSATVARQLSGMMIITIITQLISVYRSAIIAANFGVCVELDAYNFANNLSTFFLTFVSSGITTVVIPAYVKKLDRKAIDTFLTIVFSVTTVLLLGTFLFRGQLVDLLTSREPEFRMYVCSIMLLTIWIQALPAILGVTAAYYQCIGKFNLPKMILLLSNIGTTAVLIALKDCDLYQYLYILLGGAVFQFIVDLICALHLGFRFKLEFSVNNSVYKSLMAIFFPTLFSTGIYKVNTMIDSLLSSNIGIGQLTILSYANTIVGMVNTLIIGNLITYVYPKIVEAITQTKKESQKTLWKYAITFHIAVCLIVVGFVSVGREFIGLLYEHGEFTASAATAVYLCMSIYMFAQQNNIVRDLVYRYFFAYGDTKITVQNGMLTSTVNIMMSIILVRFLGVYGIVLGTFIAGLVSLLCIVLRLKKSYGFAISMRPIVREFIKTEIAVLASITVVFGVKNVMPELAYLPSFILYGCLSVIVYSALILALYRSKIVSLIKK